MNQKRIRLILIMLFVLVILGTVGDFLFNSKNENIEVNNTSELSWNSLSQEQVVNAMEKDDVILVDLREVELYQNNHIPGSINIPFNDIRNRYTELDANKEIIFICHSGRMGADSSQFLIDKGYKQVGNLNGGMNQWSGPLESGQQ
ncbi:rhodanese-like domain-containing protein [Cytobacillus sp. Hm23]